jgi:sortase family protein
MQAARSAAPLAALALGLLVALSGCAGTSDTPSQPLVAPAARTPAAVDSFRSPRTHPAVAPPVRLRVPAAHVDTGLQRLGRAADGTIQVPSAPATPGWYAGGPRPGQRGPAVILGHVDSAYGPAVFIDLEHLRPGDRVHVDRSDGSTVNFRVTRLIHVAKHRFPTDLVYAPTLQPSLRLVTCGGKIDPHTRHYRDNVIVLAVAA